MRIKLVLVILAFFSSLYSLKAQSDEYYDLMNKGKQLMAQNNFNQASVVFRQVLTLDVEIPAEFCYYFAETLFQIGQYSNSEKFIDKYYELTDRSGKYINEIQALEAKLTAKTSNLRSCELCDDQGYIKGVCPTCDGDGNLKEPCSICLGKAKISCTLCAGNGVVISVNVFGDRKYNTCHRCEGKGFEPCPRCNGDGINELPCSTCNGAGYISSRTRCDHKKPNP